MRKEEKRNWISVGAISFTVITGIILIIMELSK